MTIHPTVWDVLFAYKAALARDPRFVGPLRRAGCLAKAGPEPVAQEYLRYLYLDRTIPGGAVAPWGARLAASVVGEIPGLPPRIQAPGAAAPSYERTLKAYAERFGQPPAWFWTADGERPAATLPDHLWAWGTSGKGIVVMATFSLAAMVASSVIPEGASGILGVVFPVALVSTLGLILGGIGMLMEKAEREVESKAEREAEGKAGAGGALGSAGIPAMGLGCIGDAGSGCSADAGC